MEELKSKVNVGLFKIYIDKFWGKYRSKIYSALYRTYHPSTYTESFTTPDNQFSFVLDLVDDAVSEGNKLGLIDSGQHPTTYPTLNDKLKLVGGTHLDWAEAILLFKRFYDIVEEFRCYCGEMGIDPNCEGKCMDDFPCLKKDYNTLQDFMFELVEFGIPVSELIGPRYLNRLKLVDTQNDNCGHEIGPGYDVSDHNWLPVNHDGYEYEVCDGCGLRRDPTQITEAMDSQTEFLLKGLDILTSLKGLDRNLLADYIEALREWGKYNTITTDLSPYLTDPETVLKGELGQEILEWATKNDSWPPNYDEFFKEQGDPLNYLWENSQKVRDAMTRTTLHFISQNNLPDGMDSVNRVFKSLARKVYVFILQSPFLTQAQNRKNLMEDKQVNQDVEVGDVIQLLHMEDPWKPVPIASKGVVMGFESMGSLGEKILVRWIIDAEKEEFKNMPLLPDVDVYRLVPTPTNEGIVSENKVLLNEQETQNIYYTHISEPKFYGGKGFVYLKTKDKKNPKSETSLLYGPNGYPTITINSYEVNPGKFGGLQINYNNETRGIIDTVFDHIDTPKLENECDFNWVTSPKYWNGTSWKKKLAKTIQNSINQIYAEYKAPYGLPTPLHIKGGIINLPETEAYGTNHGWSILNFFQTNPSVRKVLVKKYEESINGGEIALLGTNCKFNIDKFIEWIEDNKQSLFGYETGTFKEMVTKNQSSWRGGSENEMKAAKKLMDLYDGWDVIYGGEPGIMSDALEGSDIKIINNDNGEVMNIQVKGLQNKKDVVQKEDNKWWVKSGWLKRYPKTVTHFLFGPTKDSEGNVFIFKNEGQQPTNTKEGEFMVFTSPPINKEIVNESKYKSYWS